MDLKKKSLCSPSIFIKNSSENIQYHPTPQICVCNVQKYSHDTRKESQGLMGNSGNAVYPSLHTQRPAVGHGFNGSTGLKG